MEVVVGRRDVSSNGCIIVCDNCSCETKGCPYND